MTSEAIMRKLCEEDQKIEEILENMNKLIQENKKKFQL